MTENNRCRVKWACAGLRNMLCQRARNPPRSRPRRCAISSSTLVLVEIRPLRLCFCIASARLLRPIESGRRSLAISYAIDPALVADLGHEIQAKLLADDAG